MSTTKASGKKATHLEYKGETLKPVADLGIAKAANVRLAQRQ